jgi:hypothetical protein
MNAFSVAPAIQNISSDQARMLVKAKDDLYMIDIANQAMVKLTDRAQATSTITVKAIVDDGRKVFYSSNQDNLSLQNLFQIISPF